MNDWQSMELHQLSAYSVRHRLYLATNHLCLALISSLTMRLKLVPQHLLLEFCHSLSITCSHVRFFLTKRKEEEEIVSIVSDTFQQGYASSHYRQKS